MRITRLLVTSVSALLVLGCSKGSASSGGNDAGDDAGTFVDTDPATGTETSDDVTDGTGSETDGTETDTGSGADIHFTIDADAEPTPISPFIYGRNDPDWTKTPAVTLARHAGARWTTYNWENNASCSADADGAVCDGFLGGDAIPGEAVRMRILDADEHDAAALITLPLSTYVAADKDGALDPSDPELLTARFDISRPYGPWSLDSGPDLGDDTTYQNELVYRLLDELGDSSDSDSPLLFFGLDDEPDRWHENHPAIFGAPATYEELKRRTVDIAAAVKMLDKDALVFGLCGSDYFALTTLGDSPDADTYGELLDYFLVFMASGEAAHGRRLIDAVDIHWRSAAQGDGVPIISSDISDPVVRARLQAPRSLWDPSYEEQSPAAIAANGPIALIPWIRSKIDALYPFTEISLGAYDFGAADHISGALAQADALGIFARESVFAAAAAPTGTDTRFVDAAFRLYLDYDGEGSGFGDGALPASSDDIEATSIYASRRIEGGGLVAIALNKTEASLDAAITIDSTARYSSLTVYVLDENGPEIRKEEQLIVENNRLELTLPAWSASVLVLDPAR